MSGHILIIEDNPQNLYMMRFLLEKNGCTVIAAKNGPEGIEKARKHRPRLILLDIQLPGMDGYDVAEALKNHPETLDLPIIAVTSYAMSGDKEKILAAGPTVTWKNLSIRKPLSETSRSIFREARNECSCCRRPGRGPVLFENSVDRRRTRRENGG